jgi:predicted permease
MEAIFGRRLKEATGGWSAGLVLLDAAADVLVNSARTHVDVLRQDLRQVGRTLRRSPGFAATVVAVSALGVGATTAAFTLTDHVLVRPLPFPHADRLVRLWQSQRGRFLDMELSPANFRDWQRLSQSFEGMAAFHGLSVNLVGGGEPERLEGTAVTAAFLDVLGVPPLLGRGFHAEDDREGAAGVVVLSYPLWQARFGGDPQIVGRTVLLDDVPHEVVGVMPRHFQFPRRETRFWRPMRLAAADLEARDDDYLEVVARLRPGVSVEDSRTELSLVAAQLERQFPETNERVGASVFTLRDQLTQKARVLLLVLFGASLGVLLIACTNLASLFLARALERRREIAVRAALGAGRDRLIRQLLTESLLLAGVGGGLGILLARAALPLAVRLVPNALPIAEMPALDLRVLGFASLATLLTAILFGLVPALRLMRNADAEGLREGVRTGGGARERLRSALVVAEVTVCVVLLVSSGLLIRALVRVQSTDPGFHSEGVFTLRTWLPSPRYQALARRAEFYESVLGAVRARPDVADAAYISYLPMVMTGGIWGIEAFGQPRDPDAPNTASIRYVTPRFFATLGIPLRRGRDVSETDTAAATMAAVVSESFAARYWPEQDPIGQRFRFGPLGGGPIAVAGPFQDRTVIGVVGDIRVRGLERKSEPQVYLPYRQHPDDAMGWYIPKDLVIRTSAPESALVPALRGIVARADPLQPVSDLRSLSSIVEGETAPRRVQVRVLGAFAAVALLLAGIGIHGLLAFMVSNRAQEIGVRMALGAGRADILSMVLRSGARLGLVGVGLGLVTAFAAGQALQALLAGVSPRDAVTFLAAAGVALGTTFLGSVRPALRAIGVDPLTVMRAE